MLQNLAARPEFSNLVSLAKNTGMDSSLNGNTQYTLFAPTNDAFAKISADNLKALSDNKPLLSNLVNYHVVPGKLAYSDLLAKKQLTTVDGRTLPITVVNGVVNVGGAKIPTQGIDSKNGMIYPINSLIMPPGFAMPQVSQSTGLSWGWLPWLIGGLLLAGIAYYLLTRRRKAPEMPRGRYAEEPRARYEERPVEEKRAEETMRQVRESVSTARDPSIADIAKNVDLPLSGDPLKGLNMLLDKGTFKDKPDFMGFLAKSYMQNNLGPAMAGGAALGVPMILGIINKTGIAKGFMEGDVKKYLVPLLMAGFLAVYKYLSRKPAVKVA